MCNDGDSTFILGLAAGLASLPSRLECSLPAEDRNCCAPRRQRALGCGGAIIVQLPNLMRHRVWTAGNHSMGGRLILLPPQGWLIVRSRLEDPWFWKAHESERYVECATDTTLRRYLQVRRRSVLETAAAARGVNDRTCCNLGITRQLFRSIGIGGA
ncbi:UNVERIFIED_CONTAM: hypothetical protein Sangu_3185800 [Sesamum angustifolium]|uniref:Uncharacterized protein n=1 Tax=Sesamum angustifolium TaxID=2727405 RepID=A0AAW2JND0_9LAMI